LHLGATAEAEEEVGWDEDSDDEAPKASLKSKATDIGRSASTGSSTTIHPKDRDDQYLKPEDLRKSDEKSRADSEASYDVIGAASGNPSHAPGSPKDSGKGDDSEEEDWE